MRRCAHEFGKRTAQEVSGERTEIMHTLFARERAGGRPKLIITAYQQITFRKDISENIWRAMQKMSVTGRGGVLGAGVAGAHPGGMPTRQRAEIDIQRPRDAELLRGEAVMRFETGR